MSFDILGDKMFDRVNKSLLAENILTYDMGIVAGVSGGADSIAMLDILYKLSEIYNIYIKVVHVNHGIRGKEAKRDADFVESICQKYSLDYKLINVDASAYSRDNKMSIEEAGRNLRYKYFYEEVKFIKSIKKISNIRIAIAHNKDDNAETILMNLVRGSGLKGLAGIKLKRDIIIRPLLSISRKEIEEYIRENGLSYITDSSNLGNDYTRNRIRHNIVPELVNNINKKSVDNIVRAGKFIEMADEYISLEAKVFCEKYLLKKDDSIYIKDEDIYSKSKILRAYIFKNILEGLSKSAKDIAAAHIEDIDKLRHLKTGKKLSLPYNIEARKDYSGIFLYKKEDIKGEVIFDIKKEKNKIQTKILDYKPDIDIPKSKYHKYFDYNLSGENYEIRFRKTGDYIYINGLGKKTVKAYMIDEKIPSAIRDRIPLIANGSHILWIIGYRISDYYKINKNTEKILEIRYRKGE